MAHELEKLNLHIIIKEKSKLEKAYKKMQRFIDELNAKEIPSEIKVSINSDIKMLNAFTKSENKLTRKINKSYRKTLRTLEKKLKLVPKGHYRNLWMAIGVSIFGIVLGSAYLNVGVGISIGLAIGITIGTNLDKKAAQEGKQLDLVCVSY